MFVYKNCVNIPPLSMCDDIASISRCGIDSIKNNAIINAKIESKKLQFGPSKCYNIHVGGDSEICSNSKVHSSMMSKKQHEVYLGEIICSSGIGFCGDWVKCHFSLGSADGLKIVY